MSEKDNSKCKNTLIKNNYPVELNLITNSLQLKSNLKKPLIFCKNKYPKSLRV